MKFYRPVDYKTVRSKRRSLSLTVNTEGEVIVRAPAAVSQRDIDSFVHKNRAWIEKKRRAAESAREKLPEITLGEGSSILWRGRSCRVVSVDGGEICPDEEKGQVFIPRSAGMDELRLWYYKKAEEYLFPRVAYYSALMGDVPSRLALSDARSRWGVCSGKNSIRLCYRLILCPLPVADYVVVHELSHIRHRDHSPAFWERVEQFFPDYKRARKWLRDNARVMELI